MRYIGATVFRPGRVHDIVGLEVEPGRGAVGVGTCELPMGVGAAGGKLARVGKKLARAKALRRIAAAAARTASTTTGAQRESAIKLGTIAARSAARLQREALSERDDDDESDDESDDDESDDESDEVGWTWARQGFSPDAFAPRTGPLLIGAGLLALAAMKGRRRR